MTYEKGMVDMVKLWAETCSGRECEDCAVGVLRGADVTCAEFAKMFPDKFISLLKGQSEGGISYAQEFNVRFPNSSFTPEELVELGFCRRLFFEGYLDCQKESDDSCVACWKEKYADDNS